MDLENFNQTDQDLATFPHLSSHSTRDALREIDQRWYMEASRRARWMDLLGDYAGSEPFIIDGESLFQIVLDDPLLAIAREDEPSFQIMHALQILERSLFQFKSRSAEIEIVFWQSNRHATLRTGASSFTVASRILARTLLFEHLLKLDIGVHVFSDLDDPLWAKYEAAKKPMFVMANDGGNLETEAEFTAGRLLSQRTFFFELLSRGMAVTLLKGAEYRDSKIISFVYEQSRNLNARQLFPGEFWDALQHSRTLLDAELSGQSDYQSYHLILSPSVDVAVKQNVTALLIELARRVQKGNSYHVELLYLFITHCVFLRSISMRDRARRFEGINSNLLGIILNEFLPSIFLTISTLLLNSNLSLDIDGRVFCSLVRFSILNPSLTTLNLVGAATHRIVQEIWSKIGSPPVNLPNLAASFPMTPSSLSTPPLANKSFLLLPFDNETFNSELSLINVSTHSADELESSSHLEFDQKTIFSDTQHWHNQKSILPGYLGGATPKPVDERARRRILRQNQRFMATMQTQAATLTGAAGGRLQQIKIPPVGMLLNVPKIRNFTAKPTKREGTQKLSSADKLRQKIQQEKSLSQGDASQLWWREQLNIMSKMTTKDQLSRITSLTRSKRYEEQYLGAEMRLYRIHVEILMWLDEVDPSSATARDKYTVSIMRMVVDMCTRPSLTPTISKTLLLILHSIGFMGYFSGNLPSSEGAFDRPLSFKFTKLVKSKTKEPYHKFMHITEHPVIWQLRLFGEFMDRSMDGAFDRRVPFKPDAWQREVLDSIDANDSLLVVAPTSAGKTFISYYAMEKVLRDSDDGILVYIAPTKALVTQIASEVYARFSKDLNGKSCWAIHTRDYRIHDSQKCQILVTVPEQLAIMLLSPPLARIWTPRIKRIILDEIHSIGQQEGGAVWEQIILLAPCPIIGLSATIGSPETFNTWLETVQKAHGYGHKFIQYPHRYSHLRKFFYNLNENHSGIFRGLENYHPTKRTKFLHPISLLSFGPRSLPSDLALEAGDTLKLYNSLKPYQSTAGVDIAALEPTTFFASKTIMLTQKDIIAYEAKLKDVLSAFISSSDPLDACPPLGGIIRKLEDPDLAKMTAQQLNRSPSPTTFKDNLIYLLADLSSRGELPAILFNFDRTGCEVIAQALLSSLEEAEAEWRSHSPEWKKKIREWESWKLRSKDRERLLERMGKLKKDLAEEKLEASDDSWESYFDPEDPTAAFSFAGSHTPYSKADLNDDIREMRRWTGTEPWAYKALKRGIAVHHAGMNKRYRSLIESLFRQGFIRVVIATGTLALGINAPTKTSVFCGDSPYLTALMYRQCAGRAGRRGYDLLGNVVFYGLPLDRVQRLVLSRLPSLGGNFPLTSTLTLRLLNLLDGSNYAPVAVKAVKSLMSLPHVSFGSESGRHQLLHHLRFSIEFLRRGRLLDKEGKPINLFAMAAHLYYTEPSNFALVALFHHGILHKISEQPNISAAKREFMLLMAHLFGRRYLPRAFADKSNIAVLRRKYPSAIVLPPLPDIARKILVKHDSEILDIFTGYAISYATEYASKLGPDCTLPLSKLDYSVSEHTDELSAFHLHLRQTAVPVVARSLFVANSGHGDEFKSVSELARTARESLYLNEHAIPSLSHLTTADGNDEKGLEHALNAYLLDFYTHGQVSTLASANGVRRGDVWYLLQDFTLTLTTIKASLEQLLIKASKESITEQTEDTPTEVDSGYGTFDSTEVERDDDPEDGEDGKYFKRPAGMADADWKVYSLISEVASEFDQKYRAMWA